jgi:hypothetical protein
MSIPKTVPFFGTDDETIGNPRRGIPQSQPSIRRRVQTEFARGRHVKMQSKSIESSGGSGKKTRDLVRTDKIPGEEGKILNTDNNTSEITPPGSMSCKG